MIRENLKCVEEQMQLALQKAEYKLPEPLQLIAVTKNHPVEMMEEAIEAGVTVVGENRVQEAQQKYAVIGDKVKWHLIGHLQRNKVKPAVEMFELIHSVDSLRLAEEISKVAQSKNKIQRILIQVNLVQEASKFGISIEALPDLLRAIDKLPNILMQGLMFVAPDYEDKEEVRPLFKDMYKLYKEMELLDLKNKDWKYLSMGMTQDFPIAIEEGSNLIRVGTGIFGARNY